MKNGIEKKDKWFAVRMTRAEFQRLQQLAALTPERHLAAYARKVLLRRPVVQVHHNESLDEFLKTMALLTPSLDAALASMVSIVERLHEIRHVTDLQGWIIQNEQDKGRLMSEVRAIKDLINKSYSLWSQK